MVASVVALSDSLPSQRASWAGGRSCREQWCEWQSGHIALLVVSGITAGLCYFARPAACRARRCCMSHTHGNGDACRGGGALCWPCVTGCLRLVVVYGAWGTPPSPITGKKSLAKVPPEPPLATFVWLDAGMSPVFRALHRAEAYPRTALTGRYGGSCSWCPNRIQWALNARAAHVVGRGSAWCAVDMGWTGAACRAPCND